MIKRKWPLLGVILVVLAVALIVIPISGEAVFTTYRTAGVRVNPTAALRIISDSTSWQKWWPEKQTSGSRRLVFDQRQFGPPEFFYNAVSLAVEGNGFVSRGSLLIIPAAVDSVLLTWTDTIRTSGSYWHRWKAGREAGSRGKGIGLLLAGLKSYLDNPMNVYGFRIFHEISKDSTLISVQFASPDSPATALVYAKLDGLRNYIRSKKATIVNHPMIHIDGKPGQYSTMLAFPVDRALPDSGEYRFKRFLPWKMISADVKGGEATVRSGYRQFYQYIQDYGISVMANGFSFLITDRRNETDSNKWITRFSAPIP